MFKVNAFQEEKFPTKGVGATKDSRRFGYQYAVEPDEWSYASGEYSGSSGSGFNGISKAEKK